jgi:ribosomal protein L16 Arg81 hydroxylase
MPLQINRPPVREVTLEDSWLETLRESQEARSPLVVRGLARELAPELSPAALLEIDQGRQVSVQHSEKDVHNHHHAGEVDSVETNLGEALRLVEGGRHYISQVNIVELFPELLSKLPRGPRIGGALRLPPIYFGLNLWYGSEGVAHPIHFDSQENMFFQAFGEKEFTIAPPRATLSPDEEGTLKNVGGIDIHSSEAHDEPQLADVPFQRFSMLEGDVLYMPVGWWHAVRCKSRALSVNYFYMRGGAAAYGRLPFDLTKWLMRKRSRGAARNCLRLMRALWLR